MNTRYLVEYTKKVLKDSLAQPKTSQADMLKQAREVMGLPPKSLKESTSKKPQI